jgi:hypothetical protein
MKTDQNIINIVYNELQNRNLHPTGEFDKKGRWYAANDDLINVRSPSAAWPYSQMTACRSKKYVKKVAEKYGCETLEQLRASV